MKRSQKVIRSVLPYVMTFVVLVIFAFAFVLHPVTASASPEPTTSALNPSGYGITTGTTSGNDAIQAEVKTWMDRIRLIGFGIVLIALILGGVLFGVSLGNAQRRSIAIGACLCALIGIWMIFKTETLAGYMVH